MTDREPMEKIEFLYLAQQPSSTHVNAHTFPCTKNDIFSATEKTTRINYDEIWNESACLGGGGRWW